MTHGSVFSGLLNSIQAERLSANEAFFRPVYHFSFERAQADSASAYALLRKLRMAVAQCAAAPWPVKPKGRLHEVTPGQHSVILRTCLACPYTVVLWCALLAPLITLTMLQVPVLSRLVL